MTKLAWRFALALALPVAGCDNASASGLDGDQLVSTLTPDEKSQLCAYEAELIAESDTCQAPPSDICVDPDRFTDDMVCGYTVEDVEQCFQARLLDPCAPSDPLGCQTIEDCECLDPEVCDG